MSQYRYVTRVALTVAMGGFLMGFDASVISGVVTFIEPEFQLSNIEVGWAVASLTLTATLAMMVARGGDVTKVLAGAMPAMMAGLSRNAASNDGANALAGALDRDPRAAS